MSPTVHREQVSNILDQANIGRFGTTRRPVLEKLSHKVFWACYINPDQWRRYYGTIQFPFAVAGLKFRKHSPLTYN